MCSGCPVIWILYEGIQSALCPHCKKVMYTKPNHPHYLEYQQKSLRNTLNFLVPIMIFS